MSKIQFWKQFTTYFFRKIVNPRLLLICQRYNFESNSQQLVQQSVHPFSCYWYVKDTILKAIHNIKKAVAFFLIVVTDMSKIQFWKQFTTSSCVFIPDAVLLLICQRYNFESNSQQNVNPHLVDICCYWYVKDTILKAIHNSKLYTFCAKFVVTDMSKIQFWKQFTTYSFTLSAWRALLLICQRYNFESNSQHVLVLRFEVHVVTDMSKIQIWMQFTTWRTCWIEVEKLLLICQR